MDTTIDLLSAIVDDKQGAYRHVNFFISLTCCIIPYIVQDLHVQVYVYMHVDVHDVH